MTGRRGGRGSATELERRYRRWLLAYPAEYRRERGDELVGTLLDLAGPERTRPRPLDILDLLRAAATQRLGRFLADLLTAPRRRGNGQIMAYVAFGLACVISFTMSVSLAMVAWSSLTSTTEVIVLQAATCVLLPLLTRIGVTARSRGGRLVVALLLTGAAVLFPVAAGVFGSIGFAEWLAVAWFRPVVVDGLAGQAGEGRDDAAT